MRASQRHKCSASLANQVFIKSLSHQLLGNFMYIRISPFSLKSCFGHMGEVLVWSTWLCSAHPPFQATSPPLSVTYASIHFRGSFKLQSSHLILNFVLKMSHTQQKYTCSLASGCRKVLFAGSRNDPELLFLILVRYFLKL